MCGAVEQRKQRHQKEAAAVAGQGAAAKEQSQEQQAEGNRPFRKGRKRFSTARTGFNDLVEATAEQQRRHGGAKAELEAPVQRKRQSNEPQMRRERHRRFCDRKLNTTKAAAEQKRQEQQAAAVAEQAAQ